MTKGRLLRIQRAMDHRRLAKMEEGITQQLARIRHLATTAHDTTEAEAELWTLRQAHDALVQQRRGDNSGTSPRPASPADELEVAQKHIARQEEAIRHLAAAGHSTALAEKRLSALRRSLDAMLERRRANAERQAGSDTASPSST